MRMFDVDGNLVNVDVRESKYPIRSNSRSSIQGQVAEELVSMFPHEPILEEFQIPGSRMSVDFFMPKMRMVVEVDGEQHFEFISFFHGDRKTDTKFAGQISRDRKKEEWCEINKFRLIRINKHNINSVLHNMKTT